VLAYYEQQSEKDALIEDEAGVESSETVMSVPRDEAQSRITRHAQSRVARLRQVDGSDFTGLIPGPGLAAIRGPKGVYGE